MGGAVKDWVAPDPARMTDGNGGHIDEGHTGALGPSGIEVDGQGEQGLGHEFDPARVADPVRDLGREILARIHGTTLTRRGKPWPVGRTVPSPPCVTGDGGVGSGDDTPYGSRNPPWTQGKGKVGRGNEREPSWDASSSLPLGGGRGHEPSVKEEGLSPPMHPTGSGVEKAPQPTGSPGIGKRTPDAGWPWGPSPHRQEEGISQREGDVVSRKGP